MLKNLLFGLCTARPWRLLVVLGLLLGNAGGAWAQSVASYVPARTTGNTYTSISGTGTSFSGWRNSFSTDDNLSVATPIGFVFAYDGTSYSQFSVGTNGFITFNTGTTSTGSSSPYSFSNSSFSTAGSTVAALAPFYDDLQTASNLSTLADLNASMKYLTTGTVGTRVLTVEWINMQDFSTTSTSSFNFQLKLYEADGHIEFNYGVMSYSTTTTMSYSLGINSPTGGATAANLLTLQTANTNTFSSTASDALGGTTAANMPTASSQYSFTPPATAVAAPTTLAFTNVGYTSMRVNFVDNSTNEFGFALLRSTDNITFTLVGTGLSPTSAGTGAGYFFNSTGLTAGTTYYYQVVANSEGIISAALTGSQATSAAPPTSLAGTFTINNTLPSNATSTGGNFVSFTDAIATLNAATIAGAVTFNVSNSQTFSELPPVITATGTNTNTITFQEATLTPTVLTDNPKITPTGTAGANDGGLVLAGGDYFTFDGISVDASAGTAVEYGYLVRNATATNGTQNNTFRNAAITLNRTNTASAGVLQNSASTLGGAVVATANTGVNQNNRYLNLQIRNAYSGITLFGVSTTIVDINTEVANCAIGDPATAGDIGNGNLTGTTAAYGIRSVLQSQQSIHDNTVTNVYVAGAATGISIEQSVGAGTTAGKVYNNKVSAVRNNSTSSTSVALGIRADVVNITSQLLSVYNNFITGISSAYTGTSTATRIIRGLYLQSAGTGSGSTINAYFNSVRIDGTLSPNATSTCLEIGTSSGPVFDVRDNILANFTTGQTSATQGKHYTWISTSTTAIGATGSVSNYNDLYVVGTPGDGTRGYIGAQGTPVTTAASTVDRITLAAWQVTPAKDANSVTIDPLFASATDLHLQGASALNNVGTAIAAVTFDIDNETANRATTPDIGGDEFTPASADVVLTSINGPAAPFAAGSYPASITISNAGIAPLTTVDVSYTFNGTLVSLGTVTLASALVSGASTTIALATLTFVAGNNTLSVTLANPNSVTDPTPSNNTLTQSFRTALCGNYNVGASGDFATLDAAATALNAAGASCAVTFTLTDATYAATTGIVINQFPGGSATNTLTIKPGTGVSPLITGSIATGATLKLNGADFVTIDGSNNGTTSQNLTIENTSATGSGNAVLWLAAASATDGATSNTVKNTVIRGNSAGGFPQFTVFVGSTGASPGTTTATPTANSSNTFTNNAIYKGFYGVFVYGPSATTLDQGNAFSGNQLGQGTGNGFGQEGFRGVFQQGLTLSGNEIQNLASGTAASNLYGIFLADCKGAVVSHNSVHNISYTGTSTTKVWAINSATTTFNTAGNASANRFDTNLVYNINSTATSSTWNTVGINGGGGYGDQYYFNTVYLSGQLSAAGGTAGSAAFANGNPSNLTASTNIDVRDNIFSIVGGTGGTTATPLYASYTYGANYTGSTLDNNDLFVSVGATGLAVTGHLGTSASPTGDAATLAAWQAATTQEANSKQVNPAFTQTTTVPFDLTPTAVSLNNAGVAITGITLDYPGTTRGTVPDIGAYEFTPPLTTDLKPVSLLAPSATQTCFTNAEPVTVQVQNNGGAAIDFSTANGTVTVVVTPPSGVTNNQTFTTTLTTGTLAPGATQNVTLPGTLDMTALGAYSFAFSATVPGDILTTDNITATRTVAAPQAALPYAEPFNSSTLPTNFTTTNFSLSTSANNGGATGSYGLRVNIYSSVTSATATTPVLGTTLSSNNVLTFDARFLIFGTSTGQLLSANDRVDVQVATCGGAFTTVYTINGGNQNGTGTASASFYNYSVPLTGVGAGQKIQVRLAAAYGGSSGNDFYVDLDNLNVQSFVNTDLAPTALAAPTTTQGCYGAAEAVTVTVKNQGAATLDFSANPATVTVNVTGAATATLTGGLTSGTLAPGATQSVTLAAGGPNTNGTLDMTATGTYTFAIAATVTGDQNLANDNLTPSPTRTVTAPVAGTLSPASATLCNSGTATLTLAGSANGSIQYQSSPDNVTFTDIVGATSAAYTTPVLTSTTYYRAQVRCGTNAATSNVATITVNTPLITTTNSPQAVCSGSTATVMANGSSGTTVRFFAAATGGTALATGTTGAATASYTTPALTTAATYYAEAFIPNGGTSTATAGLSSNSAANGTYQQATVTDYPLGFKVTQAGTLASVDVYPSAAGTLTIRLYATASPQPAAAGAQVGSDKTITVTAAQIGTKVTVLLNIALAAGDYKLTNTVGGLGRYSTYSGTYPLTSGPLSVLGSYLFTTSTTYSSGTYNSFFNVAFDYASDCVSSRTPVQVNVNPKPTATASNGGPVCAGSSTTVSVALTGTGPWSLTYSDGTTSTPVTGITASPYTFATAALSASTTYSVTALSDANCTATALPVSTTVTVNPRPTAAFNGSSPATVCTGTGTTLTGTLTGTAPFTGQYSVGGGPAQALSISGSTFSIATGTLTASTTYAITALSDASCTATSFPAVFTVNPTTTTTYTGAAAGDGTNWFNAANWTACVPSSTVDAVVPSGLTNYPSLSTTATAEVRTLTIATGASLGQSAGRLAVSGNLSNSGTVGLTGGMVALLGSSPVVTGLSTFYALEVNLSSGTMALSNATSISNQLNMKTGVLNTSSFTLTLLTGSLLVEDDNSYLLGTVSVPDRTLTAGTTETFSGIGLVLTPAVGSASPGSTPVVRTTGTALTGVGTSVSIKRYFDIQPAVNTGLNVAMDFSYLNHELNGIPGGNLALFKSVTTTAGPWANQSPTTALANTISKTGIADFSIWTLGNATNPLPVELTAFTANRQGRNAALAWATATEKNSRGFEVQVSTDGRSFRTLEFVASPTANSTAPRSYAYLDREAGKAGTRYYRLRQLDLDGTTSFSPVRTVRFEAEAPASLLLTAAPNPFRQQLTLHLDLPAGAVGAPAQLSLTDAAGRTLRSLLIPTLPAGPSQLELPGLSGLASGLYFVQLALPGQPVQHLKVVKE